MSGGTYGAPRIRHALTHAGVDVGMRAVAASMRRLGLTGLNTHARPARRGGQGPVAHEDHCAHQWDQGTLDHMWITDFLPTCGARKAGSTCAPWAMRTHAVSWDTPRASSKAPTWSSPPSAWPPPPVAASPAGVVPHADRETQLTSQKPATYILTTQATVSMGQAGACSDNTMTKSLWATLTTKYYYRRTFTTRDQAQTRVATWTEDFHNRRPIHTSLGGKSPHRIRTTPSGPGNSRINKPSTTCTQAQYDWIKGWTSTPASN